MTARALRPVPATLAALALAFALGTATAASGGDAPASGGEALVSVAPPAAPAPEAGPVCRAGDAERRIAAGSSRAIAAFQERFRQEMLAGGEDPPVVLNGRGYGYGIQTGASRNPGDVIRIIEREARAAR